MDKQLIIEEVTTVTPDLPDAIRRLTSQLVTNFDEQSLSDEDVAAMINADTTSLFVAKDITTQQIVGMITLVVYRVPSELRGVLEEIVVDEAYRGKKLGERLLNAALQKAKEKKVKGLGLTSRPSRVAANHLYQKLGFEKRDTNVYKIRL